MTIYEQGLYDMIIEYGVATAEELNLVKNIRGGSWESVINDITSVRTGYRTFEQFLHCEFEEFED